jgi:hypothetical protein
MTVDGDRKTPDVRTILRQSLETSLATRIDGCRGVMDVITAEASSVETQMQELRDQIKDILDTWVARGAFDETERSSISGEQVEARAAILDGLAELLATVKSVTDRQRTLEVIQAKFSDVHGLPNAVAAENALRDASDDLGRRFTALRTFNMGVLKPKPPVSEALGHSALIEILRQVLDDCADLAGCHENLQGLGLRLSSFEDLGELERRFGDEEKKLEAAKKVAERQGQAKEVACKVYFGEPLLVELPKQVTDALAAEDLAGAQVVVTHDLERQHEVENAIGLIDRYKRLNDAVHLKIEQARGQISAQQNACSQTASQMRTALGGIIVHLRTAGCPESFCPDPQTGNRLPEAGRWLEDEGQQSTEERQSLLEHARTELAKDRFTSWAAKIGPLLDQCERNSAGGETGLCETLSAQAGKLAEAARALYEHKARFKSLDGELRTKGLLKARYGRATSVLGAYLEKLQFSEEDIAALAERFLDSVRRSKTFFGFRFDFDLDQGGCAVLGREDLEGSIQTGGGETQILGILEMLAVAGEFGFPIIIDEVENYLDATNMRKALDYIFRETDVQIVLTSRDDKLPDRLREWGIEHRAYLVRKNPDGYTKAARIEPWTS